MEFRCERGSIMQNESSGLQPATMAGVSPFLITKKCFAG